MGMTDNELIARLRSCSSDEAMWSIEAADRIEQLGIEVDEIHKEVMSCIEMWGVALVAKREEEAKLAKAVEFIQEVRRNGDTRLASMDIAVLAELEK